MQVLPNNGDAERERDKSLVTRVQNGDYTAIEELYARYSRQAYGLALRILNNSESAEDAVQDAFLRFWRQPGSFDSGKGRFVTWLLSIVHNLCIDQVRRKRHQTVSMDQEETQQQINYLADNSTPVHEEVWLSMQRTVIQQALDNLPQEQSRMIEMAFFKGLTHTEIAHETGQPLGTVKSRIRQGLMKLKGLMSSLEMEPGN